MLLLPGCGEDKPDAQPTDNRAAAADGNSAAATPVADAKPVTIEHKDDVLEFSYAWPAEAAAIPKLNDWLNGNAAKIEAQFRKQGQEDKVAAEKDDFPYHAYGYEEKLGVAGDTPRVLVLDSEGYVYTGGAHGYPVNTVIIWDKQTEKRLAAASLIDMARLASIGRTEYCAELNRQRAERRQGMDDGGMMDEFTQCPDMTKQSVYPVSRGGKALDTIHIWIGPYEAGPYAEGIYEIDLPVDAALMGTVQPGYRDAFAPAG